MTITEFIEKQAAVQGPEDDPDPLVSVRGYGRMKKSQCRMLAMDNMNRIMQQMAKGLPFNHNDYDLLKSFMDALL